MRAIVRGVPDSFVDALAENPRRIDLRKARRQHQRYVAALTELVDEIAEIPADESHPDCVFVEDQAVVHEGRALIAVAGHPSRRGEAAPVRYALERMGLEIHDMELPATLDGGDVLRVRDTLYVGRSGRTNHGGISRLAAVFGPVGLGVVPVGVDGLHLKSVCSSPVDGLVLVAADTVEPALFDDAEVLVVPAEEAHGANAVGVGRTVLVAGGCHATRRALEERGYTVVEVGTSEVRKADGALTCCSIVFE
jgi:dimethylargininase